MMCELGLSTVSLHCAFCYLLICQNNNSVKICFNSAKKIIFLFRLLTCQQVMDELSRNFCTGLVLGISNRLNLMVTLVH